MRWIFRLTPEAQKKLSAILKKKLPQSEPWLHVAVKTWSQRNPFAGIVIYVWDTRKVIYEHRFNNDVLDPKNFTKDKGWQRALDNRQPLVGGRKDINEFFEFGPEFDASHGNAFDGKNRVKQTDLYKRRMKKSFNAGNESDLSDAAEYGGKIDLTKHEVHWMHDNKDKKFGIIYEDNMCYIVDETGEMIDLDDDYDSLINFYQLVAEESAIQLNKDVIVYCWHLVNNMPEEPKRHKVTAIETVAKVLKTTALRKHLGIVELEGYVEDGLVKTNAFAYLLDNKYWAVNIANNAFERVSIMPVS